MSDTPETDSEEDASHNFAELVVPSSLARRLERERDEAQAALTDIHRWIERNHPDGFIDSLTFHQNLERVADRCYDRLELVERERDEARNEIEGWKNKWECAVEMAARAEVERDEAIQRRMETILQCELYEQERDRLRQLLVADSERVDAYLGVCTERDEAREALREMWQSGDAFLPHVDSETINRWRKAAGWDGTK
jgi:hypothetical protein